MDHGDCSLIFLLGKRVVSCVFNYLALSGTFQVGIAKRNLTGAMINQLDLMVFTHIWGGAVEITHSTYVILPSAFLTLLCNPYMFTDDLILTIANIMVEKRLVNQKVTNLQCKVSSIGSVKNTRNA